MTKSPDDRSVLSVAYEWASRIIVVSLVMVLPGVAGYWIDTRLGTVCLFLAIGLIAGSIVGIRQLLHMTRQQPRKKISDQ